MLCRSIEAAAVSILILERSLEAGRSGFGLFARITLAGAALRYENIPAPKIITMSRKIDVFVLRSSDVCTIFRFDLRNVEETIPAIDLWNRVTTYYRSDQESGMISCSTASYNIRPKAT